MSDTQDFSNRRDFPRAPVELKVEYRRLNTFFADYTKNISNGGTFIKTQKPLDIGTDFVFRLVIPHLEEPIVLTGQVQWIINPGEEGPGEAPGMGIKFKYKDKEERRRIEETVEDLMKESLGEHLFNKLLQRDPE